MKGQISPALAHSLHHFSLGTIVSRRPHSILLPLCSQAYLMSRESAKVEGEPEPSVTNLPVYGIIFQSLVDSLSLFKSIFRADSF